MEDREAREIDALKVPFGRFRNAPYRDVPRDYLAWLADQKRAEWLTLHRYLNSRHRQQADEAAEHSQEPPDWPE